METSTSAEGGKKPAAAAAGDEDLSMEEILQSIRKIIADDDKKKPEDEEVPGSDVLELTEMVEEEVAAPAAEAPLPQPPADVLQQIDDALVAHQAEVEKPKASSLLSDKAAAAASASITRLKNAESEPPLHLTPAPGFRSGNTIEDLVEGLLRPMMKEWLDANLPSIVERIVQREIKKLTQ